MDEPLPVAVIGLGAFGQLTLEALRASPLVQVVGVSDRNAATAEQIGRKCSLPSFSDNRSLLAQTRPAAVFLSVPPTAAPELLSACAERCIHVWKELPLARNLDEAVSLTDRMERAGVKFAIGTQRRFAAGYRRAKEMCGRLGRISLARAHYLFNWGPNLGWRGDKASAGGGALLELGYHCVDLLVWLLGLPSEVYGASVGGNRPDELTPDGQPLPPYDTDDTATAILRYASGAMATVVTTRRSGPVSEELDLHGRGGSLTASSESCICRDPDGNVLDRVQDEPAPQAVFRRQAETFVRAVRSGGRQYECSARENLLAQAVIEAIYLSDRTSQPENPERMLKARNLSVEHCLSLRPGPEGQDVPPAEPV
ncbi:MAG TPA: hypothetical protein DCX07_14675 [Phycisphaerales bacterium]|nr:hypothetical protein [Phycisphaerales bacterium]